VWLGFGGGDGWMGDEGVKGRLTGYVDHIVGGACDGGGADDARDDDAGIWVQ